MVYDEKRLVALLTALDVITREFPPTLIETVKERYDTPYHILVSALLSARARDRVTEKVIDPLFSAFPTLCSLGRSSAEKVIPFITTLGLFRVKAAYLVAMAKRVEEYYGGVVPREEAALITLAGVGPKIAALVMSEAYAIPAICVDTHVMNFAMVLGLVKKRDPRHVAMVLQEKIPQSYWSMVNRVVVKYGQQRKMITLLSLDA